MSWLWRPQFTPIQQVVSRCIRTPSHPRHEQVLIALVCRKPSALLAQLKAFRADPRTYLVIKSDMDDWATVWSAVAGHGFQITQFTDHFKVSMLVMELPDDFEMEHNGQIHLEPRRMQLPRELVPVKETLILDDEPVQT